MGGWVGGWVIEIRGSCVVWCTMDQKGGFCDVDQVGVSYHVD